MKTSLPALVLMALLTQPTLADTPKHELDALLAIKPNAVKGMVSYELCRGCHRADASGRAEAEYPQLAGQHAAVIIKQMLDVRAGRRDSHKMLPFITEEVIPLEDIAHIAAFLHELPVPENNGKGDGNRLAQGQKLYERDCASCHGDNGEGDGAKLYPRVAGQHFPYLFRESKESRDLGRRNANTDMVRVIKPYNDADLAAVSDYMSRLKVPKR